MRLVLDTNTALSGLLWGGTPGRLIDAALVVIVTPAIIVPTIIRDPTDDHVLAAALAAEANLIASGDAHLLDLKNFHGIEIVTASVAVERIASSG